MQPCGGGSRVRLAHHRRRGPTAGSPHVREIGKRRLHPRRCCRGNGQSRSRGWLGDEAEPGDGSSSAGWSCRCRRSLSGEGGRRRAADPRRDDRRRRLPAQRPARRPRRQPARVCALLRGIRERHPPPEHDPLRLPRPRAQRFYSDWESAANDCVAILRSVAGRNPYDRDVSDLVGELSTQSHEVRTRWDAHRVRFHLSGIKHFHHPAVGDISPSFNRLDLAADPGLTIFTYTAEPGSRDEETLNLLGGWAATTDTLPANQATR
jgi:hypothetical protein